ncbi:MAG TPA: hypothetical protein VFF39_09225 [Verrucomicrobiae bacterium]|jgi:hypothetical protein|nr:hypothetical protein [Verrucomicrobiae bacterium]
MIEQPTIVDDVFAAQDAQREHLVVVAPSELLWLIFKANCRLARIVNDY